MHTIQTLYLSMRLFLAIASSMYPFRSYLRSAAITT